MSELGVATKTVQLLEAMLAAAEAREKTLREALERLASQEGFEGAGYAEGDSFAERELRARGKFACAALAASRPDAEETR